MRRESSGHGRSSSSGRLRLTILLASMAGLLLVPVAAQADTAGTEHLKVKIEGSGAGSVVVPLTAGYHGTPEVSCKYTPPGPATGVCETLMSNEGEGYEAVLITAEAAPGSKFVKWHVDKGEGEFGCTPPGNSIETCLPFVEPPETFGETTEVTATFECEAGPTACEGPKTPTALTIAKEGGQGTITSNPAGIECTGAKTGAECKANFEINSEVTLTASPAAGFAFNGWGGCTSAVGLTCKVTMSAAKTVKAKFIATPSLSIEKAGSGQGKVAAAGISCDEGCSKASSAVKTGTLVTVKTAPAKGSEAAVFEGGTGNAAVPACEGAGPCTFTISANSSLKVKFSPIPTKTLTVNLTGPGAYKGKVAGKGVVKGLTGSAIACGSGCTTQTETFFSSDTVTLIETPGVGYTFAGWTGCDSEPEGHCVVATSSNKTVSAKFK